MKSFVGYSTDSNIRYKATSGGIGTSLIKWMFEKDLIRTAVSFYFDAVTLKYIPKMIHSYDEYTICGSIYQEIDLVNFIRSHIDEIEGTFACFALPCQTKAIRTVVERAGHNAIIIGLTCSSQQTIDATKYLLKRLKIKETEVSRIQYRGNGWPSGIQIEKKDGSKVFVPNNGSIWTQIFHSRLFIRKKCFMCQDTLNRHSDITLADPWLKRIVKEEQLGKTIIVCNTALGEDILQNMNEVFIESLPFEKVKLSQKGTIVRKQSYRVLPKLTNRFFHILSNRYYRKIVLLHKILFNIHYKLRGDFENYMKSKLLNDK